MARADENTGVDAALHEDLAHVIDIVLFRDVVEHTGEHEVAAPRGSVDNVHEVAARERIVRDARTAHPEQAERLCALAGEKLPGKQRVVVVLLDDLHDLLPRFLRHVRVTVDHAADGAAGDAREPCDVVAVDSFQIADPFCKRCSF